MKKLIFILAILIFFSIPVYSQINNTQAPDQGVDKLDNELWQFIASNSSITKNIETDSDSSINTKKKFISKLLEHNKKLSSRINNLNRRVDGLRQKLINITNKLEQRDSNLSNQQKKLTNQTHRLNKQFLQNSESLENLKTDLNLQNKYLTKQITRVQNSTNKNMTNLNHSLSKKITKKTDRLNKLFSQNSENLENLKTKFDQQSQEITEQIAHSREVAIDKINKLDNSQNRYTLYLTLAIIVVLFLALAGFIFLKKRIHRNQDTITQGLEKTHEEMASESSALDEKLMQMIQDSLSEEQKEEQQTPKSQDKTQEPDHSFALKVADEIARMEKNLAKMDKQDKYIKPLSKGLERIKTNFAATGYEMPELLGKEFDERMTVDVINFIIDESLPEGERIISKIIKPQVNYNGILIQRAQVEVSQN